MMSIRFYLSDVMVPFEYFTIAGRYRIQHRSACATHLYGGTLMSLMTDRAGFDIRQRLNSDASGRATYLACI
jgi:hypothetical protein